MLLPLFQVKKVDTSQRTNNLPRQRKAKAPNATENKTGW